MSLIKAPYYVLVLAIGLLLVVLPQINITDYVQSTITSKFIVFAFSCLVLIGGFIIMFIVSKPKIIQISKLDIILLLLFGYITINRYIIQTDYGFSIRYMELLGLGVLYIILRNISYKNYVWLLLSIVVSGIIQAIYGNLQLLGYYSSNHSGFKLTGSFFNPGPYAGFLVAVWPLALGMYIFKEMVIEQVQTQTISNSKLVNTMLGYVFEYIPLLGVVNIILVIPATHSRGAWLAVLLSSFVLLEFKYHFVKNTLNRINRTKRIALIIFALTILFTGLFGIYHFKKGSADGRLFIWKVTTEMIKDAPVFGVGFDRFKAHYMNYQANYFTEHGETKEALVADNTYYAFNEWLQFVVENGLIGLLLLVMILYTLYKIKVDKEQKCLYYILIGAYIVIGIFAFFSYPMQILPIKLVLIVLFAFSAQLDLKKRALAFKNRLKKSVFISFKIMILVIGVFGIAKGVAYKSLLVQAFKTWKNALDMHQYGAYEDAIQDFTNAYPILKKEGEFLMNYGKSLSMAKQNKRAIQILEESKQYLNNIIIETALGDAYKGAKEYNKAEIAYKYASNMIPVRFYPLYLQAKLYEESDQKNKAIAIAKMILNKEIKVPSTAIKEIKAEMKTIIAKKPLGLKN